MMIFFFFLDGTLYSWGSNDCGQLGLGPASADVRVISKPMVVKALIGVPIAFLACGGNHSFAISKTGIFQSYSFVAIFLSSFFFLIQQSGCTGYVNTPRRCCIRLGQEQLRPVGFEPFPKPKRSFNFENLEDSKNQIHILRRRLFGIFNRGNIRFSRRGWRILISI